MKATATISFDRTYFEHYYDDWLLFRAKYRRFAIPFSICILLAGLLLFFVSTRFWFFGIAVTFGGFYELVVNNSHRSRWIKSKLNALNSAKIAQVNIDGNELQISSDDGTSVIKISSMKIVPGNQGVFLVAELGSSIYLPREGFITSESYDQLLTSWKAE